MFGEAVFSASRHARAGVAQLFSEFITTFGLLCVIRACARLRSSAVPFAVGAYITGAYWFTASTSFANPAVTLARSATDTFVGIRPTDAPGFIVAQLAGAGWQHFCFAGWSHDCEKMQRPWWFLIFPQRKATELAANFVHKLRLRVSGTLGPRKIEWV